MADIKSIERARKLWEEGCLSRSLEKQGERKEHFKVLEGAYTVERLYTPLDLEDRGIDYVKDIGFPGEFPYTRGIEPTMYRGRIWESMQYAGMGTAEETNKRLKFLMGEGLTGITIALDLPTQIGYDSDNPIARKEVGRVGVAVDSLEDMEQIFEGVPLSTLTSVRTTAVCIGPIWAAFMLALCEKQGVKPDDIRVVVQNDPLREIVARGTQIFPVKPSVKFTTDLMEFCAKELPNWFPLQIADYHYKQMGAPPVDAFAFALCTVIEYVESAIARGVDIDDIAPQIEWSLAIEMDFLEAIARFRAARKLWAKIIKERFGAKRPESLQMQNQAYGYGFPLTAQEPINNIVRITVEALALALSGPQAIALPSYDEAKSIPAAEAAKIALRTNQIIAHETGVTDTVDPLGGSYYIESLTDEIEKQVLAVIHKVDEIGGATAAIETGYYDLVITRGAYEYQKAIEDGDRVVIGVNKFQSEERIPIKAFKVDPKVEAKQLAKLKELKRRRDNRAVTESLRRVGESAKKDENLVLPLLDAVKNYATIGEICDTLREVWGEWQGKPTFMSQVF
jgi:methylmalonyl-CoA mutase N-terminal domain/subunit